MAENPLLRTTDRSPILFDARHTAADLALEPIPGVAGAWRLAPLLTPDECAQLIAATEALGYASKKSRRQGPPIRTNERLLYQPPREVIDRLADRLRPHVEALDTGSVGRWRLRAGSAFLNDRWRMNRYREGEQFYPHFDSGYELTPDCRSLLSLIVYLNDDFEGGETVFFPGGQTRDHMLPGDRDAREVAVRPSPGGALLFHHYGPLNPRHAGLPPTACRRPKYILRTDLFFERDPLPLSARLFGRSPDLRRCVVLMGPPGAGKSTQLRRVAEATGFLGIDFGHAVRTELTRDTDLTRRLQAYRQKRAALQDALYGPGTGRRPSGWLPDDLSRALVEQRIDELEATHGPAPGLVIDGFPRMRSQSNHLEGSRWFLLAAVHLQVDDETRHERLRGRTLDAVTGQPYHATLAPGGDRPVTRRQEDEPHSVEARMVDWERDTKPLLEHYHKRGEAVEIDGSGPLEAVTGAILATISSRTLALAKPHFPPDLLELVADATTDGVNRSRRPDTLVFRFERPGGRGLYLKLAPPWGARLDLEAAFLHSPDAARFALPVPACLGVWTLEDGVRCLATEALAGVSAKAAAQGCVTEDDRHRLISSFATALRRIHAGPPLTTVASHATESLLERARERLARGLVPLRNFTARYGLTLHSAAELEAELERLAAVSSRYLDGPRAPLHGDACLPNFLVGTGGEVTACVDLAGVGMGDPYLDLALACWSVGHNLGGGWAERFLEACTGGAVDRDRLAFFTDLRRFLV